MIKNFLISAVICVVGEIALVIVYVVNSGFFSGGIQKVLDIFNLSSHFDNFANAIFDVKGILYFVSVIAVCLFLTVQLCGAGAGAGSQAHSGQMRGRRRAG